MEIITADQTDLDPEMLADYKVIGRLPDGRICVLHQLMFHWSLLIDLDYCGYESRYCVDTFEHGLIDMAVWDGEGHPPHWHRYNGGSRRKYPDLRKSASGAIYLDGDQDPDQLA